MYTILMPIDSNEMRARAQTEMITDLPNAQEDVKVTLLHVFEDDERAEATSPTQLNTGRTVQERLMDRGITVDTMSTSGDPSAAILQAAEEVDANQIVLGGRKRSPLGSLLFGSVSQQVMLDASRPVSITGSLDDRNLPTHECPSCGEEYYADPDVEINTCRNCGGTKVDTVA